MHINLKGNTRRCLPNRMDVEFLLPFNASLFCLTHFWPNHSNDIESFLWNMCAFLSSWWSKEKIKCRLQSCAHPALSLFSGTFSIRDLCQYPNSLSCEKCKALVEEADSVLSLVVSTIPYRLSMSHQLVSIQPLSSCNQLLSTEKRLEEK